jgi:hypothetical protein
MVVVLLVNQKHKTQHFSRADHHNARATYRSTAAKNASSESWLILLNPWWCDKKYMIRCGSNDRGFVLTPPGDPRILTLPCTYTQFNRKMYHM